MKRSVLLSLVIAVCAASPAFAATYEVTERDDPLPDDACTPDECTLRDAVRAANASVGVADKIVLRSRKPYRLGFFGSEDGAVAGDLDITNDPLAIVHPGKGRATIDAGGVDRVFDIYAPTRLEKLVITGGENPDGGGYGGGIRSSDKLTVSRSVVTGNESSSCGGGIHMNMDADLVLLGSRVTGNRAVGDGGGVSVSCFGGAGALTMKNSTIAGNRSDSDGDGVGRGGGMYFQTDQLLQSSISRSTISGNRTGPGGNQFGADEGGGIYADLGQLRITDSTVSGNRSGDNGGGISIDGTEPLELVNSTVAGNRANDNGGGIDAGSGVVSLNAVTVARNLGNADGMLSEAGGGLSNDSAAFSVENSLIALNLVGDLGGGDPIPNDCSAPSDFDSAGDNLLSTAFLCPGFDGPGDLVRAKVKIGALADNGGPTRTIALLRRSPAIDEAEPGTAPDRDQRGRKRDKRPDIGAFERGA